jgi:hypothetical protein
MKKALPADNATSLPDLTCPGMFLREQLPLSLVALLQVRGGVCHLGSVSGSMILGDWGKAGQLKAEGVIGYHLVIIYRWRPGRMVPKQPKLHACSTGIKMQLM